MNTSNGRPAYRLRNAKPEDEADIRKLLSEAPMQGTVQIAMEREPNANLAAEMEGYRHNTILVEDGQSHQLLGMGSRVVRDLYVDGRARAVGYLGQLRVGSGRHAHKRLVAAFEAMRATRCDKEMAFDLTSIISDNTAAIRLLEKGLPGMPSYRPLTKLATFVITTTNDQAISDNMARLAEPDDLPAIARCLENYLSRYQFSSVWNEETLKSDTRCRNLTPEDFVVMQSEGDISACIAIWDQRSFKQVVIKGYSRAMSIFRPVLNLLLKVSGRPRLPKAPNKLNLAYLSHLAVVGDNPALFKELITTARRVGKQRGLDYLVIALTEAHPLHEVMLRSIPHYKYCSNLYTVHWDEKSGEKDVPNGIPHFDVAIL